MAEASFNPNISIVDLRTGKLTREGMLLFERLVKLQLRSYPVSALPSASPASQLIYVSNGSSNRRLAVSDGVAWRFPDGNVVS